MTPPNPKAVEALAAALVDHLAQPDAAGKLAAALAEHLPSSPSPAIDGRRSRPAASRITSAAEAGSDER